MISCYLFRTGDGDPPENALVFWRKIRSKELGNDYLSHLEYALLGLGDTNYTTYLGYPKDVNKQLQKLGAKAFYKPGWADDAVGLEVVVDPWIENLWPALIKRLEDPQGSLISLDEPASIPEEVNGSPAEQATVATNNSDSVLPEQHQVNVQQDGKKEEEIEKCLESMASLTVSLAPLKESNLKIPVLPQSFLELTFNPSVAVSSFARNILKL